MTTNLDRLGEARNLKSRLSVLTPSQLAMLKSLYYLRWDIHVRLNSVGPVNILFGLLTLWLGLSNSPVSDFSAVQAAFGLLLLGLSLWSLITPTMSGILIWSIMFFAMGLWNILLTFHFSLGGLSCVSTILGVAQLRWAYQLHREYQFFLHLPLTRPPSEIATFYDDIWKAINSGAFDQDELYVELHTRWDTLRGLLLDDLAVLTFRRRKLVALTNKSEFVFIPNRFRSDAQVVSGTVLLENEALRTVIWKASGRIRHLYFQKYERWKQVQA